MTAKKKILIQLNTEMVERLDKIAERYSMPRATLIQLFVGQQVDAVEQSLEIIKMQLAETELNNGKII